MAVAMWHLLRVVVRAGRPGATPFSALRPIILSGMMN